MIGQQEALGSIPICPGNRTCPGTGRGYRWAMEESSNLKAVSDGELLRRLTDLVSRSRRLDADIVAHIAEVDARRLYRREAAPSMFAYCVEVLGLGESEAYLRIAAARASREYPVLLEMLRDGRLVLTAVARLASHLTPDNCDRVLTRAANRSKREIEELIAELDPQPDARSVIRKLPTPRTGTARSAERDSGAGSIAPNAPSQLVPERVESPLVKTGANGSPQPAAACGLPVPSRRAIIEPLAPSRHKVQFTASDALRDKLQRLQDLMRPTVPDGDLATIIEQAVTEKLERLEAKRFAKTKAPRKTLAETDTTPSSRRIPAPVRRAVHERDQGRCTYQDARGRRCRARERLEFHHHGTPFGRGGGHSVENVRLMCHTHNQLLAERDYGKEKMARYRGRPSSVSEPLTRYGGISAGVVDRVSPPP